MESEQLLPSLRAHGFRQLLEDALKRKKPCQAAGPELEAHPVLKLLWDRGPAGSASICGRNSSKAAGCSSADAGQRQAKVGAAMAHLRHGYTERNCVRNVTRLIERPRLQHQSGFPGDQRSTERCSPSRSVIPAWVSCDYAFSGSGNKNSIGAKIGKAAASILIVGGTDADYAVVSRRKDQYLPAIITGSGDYNNVLAERILNCIL